MSFDPDWLLSLPPVEARHAFTTRDTMLYAAGVGAQDLGFTYEPGLQALPTMAMVLAYPGETIGTEIWNEGDGHAGFRATAEERGLVVLHNGYAEFE